MISPTLLVTFVAGVSVANAASLQEGDVEARYYIRCYACGPPEWFPDLAASSQPGPCSPDYIGKDLSFDDAYCVEVRTTPERGGRERGAVLFRGAFSVETIRKLGAGEKQCGQYLTNDWDDELLRNLGWAEICVCSYNHRCNGDDTTSFGRVPTRCYQCADRRGPPTSPRPSTTTSWPDFAGDVSNWSPQETSMGSFSFVDTNRDMMSDVPEVPECSALPTGLYGLQWTRTADTSCITLRVDGEVVARDRTLRKITMERCLNAEDFPTDWGLGLLPAGAEVCGCSGDLCNGVD